MHIKKKADLRRKMVSAALAIVAVAGIAAPVTWAAAQAGGKKEASYSWSKRAPLPVTLAEVGVAAIKGNVYVVAGSATHDDGSYNASTPTLFIYNSARDSWSQGAALPWASSHVAVTVMKGKLYAVGGFDDIVHIGARNNFAVYDPARDSWTALPPLPTARGSVALAAVGGKLHVIGGRTSSTVVDVAIPNGPTFKIGIGTVNTHDVFDPAKGTWSSAEPMPGEPRDHMGVAVLNGKIHVFGGRINDFTNLVARHDVYDPASGKWSSAAPLPEARSAGAFTVLDGRIVYAGGECKPGGQPGQAMTFEAAQAYNSKEDRWVSLPDMPQGHQAFGAATIGKTAYFAGGSPMCGGGGSKDLQVLTQR